MKTPQARAIVIAGTTVKAYICPTCGASVFPLDTFVKHQDRHAERAAIAQAYREEPKPKRRKAYTGKGSRWDRAHYRKGIG